MKTKKMKNKPGCTLNQILSTFFSHTFLIMVHLTIALRISLSLAAPSVVRVRFLLSCEQTEIYVEVAEVSVSGISASDRVTVLPSASVNNDSARKTLVRPCWRRRVVKRVRKVAYRDHATFVHQRVLRRRSP